MTPFIVIGAFFGGVVTEALAVLWVHFAERDRRLALAVVGACQGAAFAAGIGGVASGWTGACAFVIGFAVGPLLGLWIKDCLR